MSVQMTTLPNGLRIVTDRVDDIESVAVGIYTGVGTRHEDLSVNGISHFLEHMLFKGTARRTALQIAEEIEDVGGYTNAYTGREMTGYYAHVLKGSEALAIDLLSDLLLNSTFPADEMERERTVILQEIAAASDTPDDIVHDYFQATAYPGQALGAPILGPADIVSRLSADDLRGYLKAHYIPSRMVVSVAGAVDHDVIVDLARAGMPLAAAPDLPAPVPARYAGGRVAVDKDIEQTQIIFGLPGPPRHHEDEYAARVLAVVLGGSSSSRLFQEIREKRGLAYSVSANYTAYADAGCFSVYAGCSPDKVAELLSVVESELARFGDTVTEREIDRARIQIKASLLMSREQMMTRAEQQARSLIHKGRLFDPDQILADLARVDAASMRRVLDAMRARTPTLAVYGAGAT